MLRFQWYLLDEKGGNIQSTYKKTFKAKDCLLSLNTGKSKSLLSELLDKSFVLSCLPLFSHPPNQRETSKLETF